MKITANRRDDILRRKAEWESEFTKQKEAHDREYDRWLAAQEDVAAPAKEYLENLFKKYPLLNANISVTPGRYGQDSLRAEIRVNEHSKMDSALSWGYEAYILNGEVVRETSSWSGMNAVTFKQIEELEQSVAALKEIAVINWYSILDIRLPKYDDYIKTPDPSFGSKPNWDAELAEAELDDIIGERKMIKVHPFDSSWYNGYVYVAIVKDSGSQYTIKEIPEYYVQRGEASRYFDETDPHRVKKIKIKPVQPTEIIDV